VFFLSEQAYPLGGKKTDKPVQEGREAVPVSPEVRIHQHNIPPLKGKGLVEDIDAGQEGMNCTGRKNKPIPHAESRPHGVVFQNPHGKEKSGKNIINNIQDKKTKKEPEQLDPLIFLGRV
jgi:hypothetical protein